MGNFIFGGGSKSLNKGGLLTCRGRQVLPLSFALQPQAKTVDEYALATFNCEVAGGVAPYTYQWKKNGTNVGTNSASLSFTAAADDNGASIAVVVTDSAGAVITSTDAVLGVTSYAYFFDGDNNDIRFSSSFSMGVGDKLTVKYKAGNSPFSTRNCFLCRDTNNLSMVTFETNGTLSIAYCTVQIDGVSIANGGEYPADTNMHTIEITATQPLSISMIGARWKTVGIAVDRRFLGLIYDAVFTRTAGNASIRLNNKSQGANQIADVGSVNATITNYNVNDWTVLSAAASPVDTDTQYHTLVIVGASIMHAAFGQDLNTPHTLASSIMSQKAGRPVNVYGYNWPGYNLQSGSGRVQEAVNHFGNDGVLYVVHYGGNNVSSIRPYDAADDAIFHSGLQNINNAIASVNADAILSDISFRNYDGIAFNNELIGTLPYNDKFYKQYRNPKYTNKDGSSVVDLYNAVHQNYATWLSADEVHMVSEGTAGVRDFITDRVAYLFKDEPMPDPISILSFITQPSDIETISGQVATLSVYAKAAVSYTWLIGDVVVGVTQTNSFEFQLLETHSGLPLECIITDWQGNELLSNPANITVTPSDTTTTVVKFGSPVTMSGFTGTILAHDDINGHLVKPIGNGLSLQMIATSPTTPAGTNTAGATIGVPYNQTLASDPMYDTTFWWGSTRPPVFEISGLTPNSSVTIGFVGTRPHTIYRATVISEVGNPTNSATFDNGITPPPAPVYITVIADSLGKAMFTLSAANGSDFIYLGGISIDN